MPGKARALGLQTQRPAAALARARRTRAPTGERCSVSSSSLPARPGSSKGFGDEAKK